MEKEPDRDDPTAPKRWAHYWQIGLQLPVTMLVCAGIGYWLDDRFSSLPWGTISGVFLGLVVGTYQLIQLVRWERKPPPPPPGRSSGPG